MTARKTTSKPLSALRLENMKPGATVTDTEENIGLRVTRSSAGWRYRYRFKHPETGKLAELTLFTRNAAALAGARVLFANLKAQRRADEVPKLPVEYARAPEPEKTQVPNLPTVADIVTVYLRDHVYPRRKLKGAKETDRVLTNHVVATIGDLPAENLDRQTVLGLVKNQISAGHHAQAGVVLRELDAAIEFAVGDTLLPDDFIDPAQLAKRSLQQRKTRLTANRRQRYLTDDEIKAFLAWLPISAFSRNHRYALALTLETGCRSGETIAAEWRHINLDAGIWHPPETKTGTPRQVKLPRQTVEWLSAARLTDAGGTHYARHLTADTFNRSRSVRRPGTFEKPARCWIYPVGQRTTCAGRRVPAWQG
jgi:hypothetical protein